MGFRSFQTLLFFFAGFVAGFLLSQNATAARGGTDTEERVAQKIDAFRNCAPEANICGGTKVSTVLKHATQTELLMIQAAGGIQSILEILPSNPSEILKTAVQEGPSALARTLLPAELGDLGAAFSDISDAAKSDSAALASILKPTTASIPNSPALASQKIPLSPLAGTSNTLAALAPSGRSHPAANTQIRNTASVEPSIEPIWHPGTDLNLFQIVSNRISKSSSRVGMGAK